MRVLVVAPRLEIGGTETHLARALPRLRQAGLDVSLFTIARGGPLDAALIAGGVPVLGVATGGGRRLASLRAILALRREIRRLRPDILHFFLAQPYLIGSLASLGIDAIKVMSRRSLSYYQLKHPVLTRVERHLHRAQAALIANSNAVAAQLVEESGSPAKVGIIYNGIDLPRSVSPGERTLRRSALGIPSDAVVLAVVANLIGYKGHSDLLDALGGVAARLKGPWQLMLVGRDQGIGTELKRRAEALGIMNNVLWLGERANVQDILAAADIGVLPSHEEGFSNSLLEKMAQGLPVVATAVGGNIDAVIDGETGFLVPVADPAALGEAIGKLYEDAAMRARIGAAGRLRVQQHFSLEACTCRYLDLYCGLMQGRRLPVAELIDPRPHSRLAEVLPVPADGLRP